MADQYRIRGNLHTHTTFCDGKNTPREMIERAIALGWEYIGFSGHIFTPNDPSYCMSPETTEIYFDTLAALREEYSDRIRVVAGIEHDDSLKTPPPPRAAYVIGSVHYVRAKDGALLPVDHSPNTTMKNIAHLGGDPLTYAEAYFAQVARLPESTQPHILGHFDLLTKFKEKGVAIDEQHPRYRRAWLDAMDALIPTGIPFEINTGAISRSWRTSPYPSKEQLNHLAAHHVPVVINTDAHSTTGLDCFTREALEIALALGINLVQPEDFLAAFA
jgi:histidinol-phosphatase (PHP family)